MASQTPAAVVQDPRLVELGINVVRGIAMDAPEAANSGHSGTAMALAPLAHVLWTRIMHYDPRDPEWPDRDRFVLSNGHACILQYSMLHLTGYDLSLEDLRQFRQWGSRTPGHPEAGHTAGIDVTTGPLGQGVGQRGRHGDRRALAAHHLRPRRVRPPHLRDRRRRLLHGGRSRTRRRPSPATSVSDGCSPSTTTTTSRSTGRPSWPTTTTCPSASRPTAGACATWARWPTTSTRWRPPSARRSTSRRTDRTPSRPCSCCAATSGGPRRSLTDTAQPTAPRSALTRSR